MTYLVTWKRRIGRIQPASGFANLEAQLVTADDEAEALTIVPTEGFDEQAIHIGKLNKPTLLTEMKVGA